MMNTPEPYETPMELSRGQLYAHQIPTTRVAGV